MSAEYSVEEVREIANKQRATMPYTAAMLTDYANLLERIKADESAVPFGYVSRNMAPFRSSTLAWQFSLTKIEPHGCIEAMPLFTRPPEQAAQLWEMKQRTCRAHELCNALRLAFPEIPELGDDGVLHEAIHDILRVDTPTAEPAQAGQMAAPIKHGDVHDGCGGYWCDYVQAEYKKPGPITLHESNVVRYVKLGLMCDKCGVERTTAEPVAQGEVEGPQWGTPGMCDLLIARCAELREEVIAAKKAAQPRAVPDVYVGELIEAATEVYRISDREHEAWRRLRAALVAARKAQRPRVGDAVVEPVTQGEQISPPRYSYSADDSVMLLNPEDSTYTRGVPDRWKLVPVEPTPKMLAAVSGMEISVRVAEDDTAEYPVPEDDCAEIYRTMLAAAQPRAVPKLDAEDWAVLQRLRNALPDVGLNGWHRGVTVLSKLLAAAPSPGESA